MRGVVLWLREGEQVDETLRRNIEPFRSEDLGERLGVCQRFLPAACCKASLIMLQQQEHPAYHCGVIGNTTGR